MKCRICGNYFNGSYSFICPSCYKNYPINIETILIPFFYYDCLIVNLNIKYNAIYTYEISTIYIKLKNIFDCEILITENLDMSNNGIARLEIISRLLNSNIIVITNNILSE